MTFGDLATLDRLVDYYHLNIIWLLFDNIWWLFEFFIFFSDEFCAQVQSAVISASLVRVRASTDTTLSRTIFKKIKKIATKLLKNIQSWVNQVK